MANKLQTYVAQSQLTQREYQCLMLVIQGKTAKQIAKLHNISYRTVQNHVQHLKDKLGCRTRSELFDLIYQQQQHRSFFLDTSAMNNMFA